MNPELMNKIKSEIKIWNPTKSEQQKCLTRVRKYFIPGLNDILTTKFKNKNPKVIFVGMGGCNIVVRIGKRLFRISYDKAAKDCAEHVKYEFETLHKHDFGMLAPIDFAFKPDNIWWHEIQEAYPYQGATLTEYSKLLHKVIKLSEYNLYWTDIHNGNLMRDRNNNLVIADFDISTIEWVVKNVQKYKNVKLSDIKQHLDIFINDWRILLELRFKIYAYLKIKITCENWMKFCFGEFVYKSKYNITNCYTTALFNEQVKNKGNIGF